MHTRKYWYSGSLEKDVQGSLVANKRSLTENLQSNGWTTEDLSVPVDTTVSVWKSDATYFPS